MKNVTVLLMCIFLSMGIIFAQANDTTNTEEEGDLPELLDQPSEPASTDMRAQIQIRSNIVWLGQGTSTLASGGNFPNGISSSQILYQLGIGGYISFSNFLGIAPSLDVYLDDYVFLSELGRAFPTQMQTGASVGNIASVLALGFNIPWLMSIPFDDNISFFNLALGLSFIFRFPIVGLNGSNNIMPIGNYLLGEGRWLYLYLEPSFAFRLAEWFGFSLGFKTSFPIWHVWDSYNLPVFDHLELGVILALSIFL